MTYVGTGRKELKREWPFTKGRTAGTTKQEGTVMNLQPKGKLGVKRTTQSRYGVGL